MKTLIADKFSESHLERLTKMGCEVVDQSALRAALQEGRLRAGLDVFDPEPAEGTGPFSDPILDLPSLYGSHHIGASTEQAQEAIAEEALRVIATFVRTGVVLNCVNLATRTPARWQLVVDGEPAAELLAAIKTGNADILGLELLRLGD